MQNVSHSLVKLCLSNCQKASVQCFPVKAPNSLLNILSVQHQQTRLINKKGYLTEPGWKAIGHRWLVKFPEKYTIEKLPLFKLAGRDPATGELR